MRDFEANLRTFYYAMYVKKTEAKDSDGNENGQKISVYTNPRKAEASISTPSGSSDTNPFGSFSDYDAIITTVNNDFHADKYSVLWIDKMPVIETDGSTKTPWDYVVKRVAKNINQNSYAISKTVNSESDSEYLKSLLDQGSISQEEYDKYSAG